MNDAARGINARQPSREKSLREDRPINIIPLSRSAVLFRVLSARKKERDLLNSRNTRAQKANEICKLGCRCGRRIYGLVKKMSDGEKREFNKSSAAHGSVVCPRDAHEDSRSVMRKLSLHRP